MARYVRIRLANGDSRHVTLPQDETHTQWAAREFVAESRWAQTVEGTLSPRTRSSSCPSSNSTSRPGSTMYCPHRRRARRRERARGFLSETLRDEPDQAGEAARPGYRSDYTPTSVLDSTSSK